MFNTRRNQMNPKGNGGGTYTMTIDTAKERERVYSDLKVSPFPVQISDYFAALDVIDAKDAGIERLRATVVVRSEEHTSELQSRGHLVCRLLLEKKKISKPKK